MHPVESIFGQLKFNRGYTYFLLRSIEFVKAEFAIMCLSYNLRKMINHAFILLKSEIQKSNIWLIWYFQAVMRITTYLEKNIEKHARKTYMITCQ